MQRKTPHVNIHYALNLNGDENAITEYYKKWSDTYDKDVVENYYGIDYICALLHRNLQQLAPDTNSSQVKILDVGCGTGLLGKPLHDLGYRNLDGVDLSADMISKARCTGFYSNLHSAININHPVPESLCKQYDAAICIGTFTPGHVQPESLRHLAAMTRQGGLVVLSTRIPYYDTTDFQKVSDQLVSEELIRLRQKHMNSPYRDDGDAHYWVYDVLSDQYIAG